MPATIHSTARSANTFFNVALLDEGLFWDLRVESLGKLVGANGAGSGIRTPNTALGVADPTAGPNLAAAQARFPVANTAEMRGSLLDHVQRAGRGDSELNGRDTASLQRLSNFNQVVAAIQPHDRHDFTLN